MSENKFEGYFNYYISKVNDLPLVEVLESQKTEFLAFIQSIKTENMAQTYQPGKWTIKEVIFHIIETEVIMLYRAIRISRGDKTPLSGYDEDLMVNNARVPEMNDDDLISFFTHTRSNTLFYFRHFTESELNQAGTFSNLELDTRGIGYLLAGHLEHHKEVIMERYL